MLTAVKYEGRVLFFLRKNGYVLGSVASLDESNVFSSQVLRFARLLIDLRHKEVKSQASQEDESGENRGRANCSCVTCKESLHGGAQKPDLDN